VDPDVDVTEESYAYTEGDPVNSIDPTGTAPEEPPVDEPFPGGDIDYPAAYLGAIQDRMLEAGESVTVPADYGAPLFSQSSASFYFSPPSEDNSFPFAGKSIAYVADGLRDGTINPSQVPVKVVIIDGQVLAVNTRSAIALTQAGIAPQDWDIENVTDDPGVVRSIQRRLTQDGMTGGSSTIRVRGAGGLASKVRELQGVSSNVASNPDEAATMGFYVCT
jgi:hypothetical protein